MKEIIIKDREAGQRLDKFLKKYLDGASAGFLYKMLRKKNITLNGKKATGRESLLKGDLVKLFLSDETILGFQKKADGPKLSDHVRLEFLYEDADIVAVHKPAGMLSQPGTGRGAVLGDYLLAELLSKGSIKEEDLRAFRPSPLNRLDRNTSGIVLCGKSLKGAQYLSGIIRDKSLIKEYRVLVDGKLDIKTRVITYFIKDAAANRVKLYGHRVPGSDRMETEFRTLMSNEGASLLAARLITGKTHQIRAQLAYLGHPVLGDPKYGREVRNRELRKKEQIQRQMLHAYRVTFPKTTGPFSYLSGKTVTDPLPEDFQRLVRDLKLKG